MKFTVEKLGPVYVPSGDVAWSRSHAQVPFPIVLREGTIRVYFATRDAHSRSSFAFVELDAADPRSVSYVHDQPCLSHGADGSYDDSGTMPSWFLQEGHRMLAYYTGWNKSETASYRLAIGLAESLDGGLTFQRKYPGPLMDRSMHDPVWVGQPCVLEEAGLWKMWYLSCERIETVLGHPEPFYNVKYATSPDGIVWQRENQVCIPFDGRTDAIGRPFVFRRADRYFMLHSNRLALNYRTQPEAGYRIELSESEDGIHWQSCPDFHFPKSEDGWDSIMNEYASLLPAGDDSYWVFYNGNGFGKTGFGLARLWVV